MANLDENNIDEQLRLLQIKMQDLKFDYERYFAKDLKLEPVRKREDIDRILVKFSQMHFIKASQKFTYENIISKFVALKRYWDNRSKMLELSKIKKEEGMPVKSNDHNNRMEKEQYRDVYDEYLKLISLRSPSLKPLSYNALKATLETKRAQLVAQYNCKDIEFKVDFENSKLKFKAVPKY